jgi:D-lactate dehydrogenase
MDIKSELSSIMAVDRVHSRLIDRIAYANDASYFRLVPQAVVQPVSIDEIKALLRFSQRNRIPLTFRAAGTSLSGQALTDGILVDISKHWGRYSVEEDGKRINFQPGIIGGYLNNVLKPYHRRLGPDPASIDSAMMGGILANNSSGMCCGVTENAYRTVDSMTIVLPNGFILNTSEPNASEQFQQGAPHIASGLLELRKRLLSASADQNHPGETLAERVKRRYQMKNNNGYLLNALLDFDNPVDILTHLMIGSEGTLGFIAEAALNTLPDYSKKYTGQLYFKNIQDAASAIFPLKQSGARAAEIMDRASLRSIQNLPGAPSLLAQLPDSSAAILIEYQAGTAEELSGLKGNLQQALSEIRLLQDSHPDSDQDFGFTEDPVRQAELWKLRKGIIPSVGAIRPPLTTLLTEDVVFPVPLLAEAITDLQELFDVHGYSEGVIFGHAKDGNLHFLIAQSFESGSEIRRFEQFTGDYVKMVSGKYDGALKAEHGTGRNMAAFVETEWGETAYAIMRDLKSLLDPDGMLNPGVIINDNPRAHVTYLKSIAPVAAEVDKCIECGFCESKCPSRWLTLTPRQRIVVQREISRLRATEPNSPELTVLKKDYTYDGMDTCALDGLCATACPVGINTGNLTKRLRSESIRPKDEKAAGWVAEHFELVEKLIGGVVNLGHVTEKIISTDGVIAISRVAERLSGTALPKWNTSLPYVPAGYSTDSNKRDFIYFPSCISRQLGQPSAIDGQRQLSLAKTLTAIAERANIGLNIPKDISGICCGMPFSSKGYKSAYKIIIHDTLRKFWEWSEQGKFPIVFDTTSCLYSLRTLDGSSSEIENILSAEDIAIYHQLTLIDSIEFIHDSLISHLNIQPIDDEIVLHPNCSARKMGLDIKLMSIAQKCAKSVIVPQNLGCCAFAGDRGLLFPELTKSAARMEAAEVNEKIYGGYYSSNITCEIGMSSVTGKTYEGIVYLVEKASR